MAEEAHTKPNSTSPPKRLRGREPAMKKNLSVVVEDEDILELMRILMDDDADGALAFLKKHLKGKARELLEGG
jgi:hypothetical protein